MEDEKESGLQRWYTVWLNRNDTAMITGHQAGDGMRCAGSGIMPKEITSREAQLQWAFTTYNDTGQDRSLSVGDVVTVGQSAYAVEGMGFKKLDSFQPNVDLDRARGPRGRDL